jgi:hypothetical protein
LIVNPGCELVNLVIAQHDLAGKTSGSVPPAARVRTMTGVDVAGYPKQPRAR